MHEPKVLFLDEPTSGLDPSSAANIHDMLKEMNQRGMTIFLTSHNMEELDRLCHQVAFLDNGLIGYIIVYQWKWLCPWNSCYHCINFNINIRYLDRYDYWIASSEPNGYRSHWYANLYAFNAGAPSCTNRFGGNAYNRKISSYLLFA